MLSAYVKIFKNNTNLKHVDNNHNYFNITT